MPLPDPIKYFSHEEIRHRLEPYATRGWLKRFDDVKNRGQKFWLYVVRDFNIQHPRVEMIIEDIVRVLEIKKFHKSAVRDEMNKLEAQGKLNIDTPEEEERWEKQLQDERDVQKKWDEDDHKARMKQRDLDIEAIEAKEKEEEVTAPIPIKAQDPKQNESLKKENKLPNATISIKVQPDNTAADNARVEAPIVIEHPKEPTEEEKKQAEFKPKGRHEEEPPTEVKLKEVEIDGEIVYDKEDKGEPKEKLDKVEGLPSDAVKRLNDIGVYTKEAFGKMDKVQAKQILGTPLFTKLQSNFKS